MNFQEAKTFLGNCKRHELRDHTFGDCEVTWFNGAYIVANGYFGSSGHDVTIDVPDDNIGQTKSFTFSGKEADELHYCGVLYHAERNDETGPEEYYQR